ncbi:hypothetical protein AN958_01902 [Leucoagaricus sp. SymC.cos]|nr:hypothetical protein AN958_01902 [Leucoagaricus sp. SymC.cos]
MTSGSGTAAYVHNVLDDQNYHGRNNVPTMVDHDTRARGAEQQEEEEEEEQEIDAVDRSLRSREVIVSNGIQVDLGVSSSSSSSTSPDFTLPSISISREAPALISTSTSIPAISAASTSTATLTAGSTLNAQQANASRPGSMATTAVAIAHRHHHHPLPPYTHAHSHHGFGFGLPPTLPPIMTDTAVDADTDIINEDTANDDDGGEARERLGEVQLPSPSLSGFYDWLEGASVGAARGTGSEGDRTGVGMGVGAVSGRVEPAGFTPGGDATGAAVVVDERSGSRVQTHGASWQEDVLSGLGLNQGSFNNNNTSSQPNGERRDSGEPTTARSEGVVVDIDMVSDMEVERLPWTLGVPATTTTSQAPPLRLDSPNDQNYHGRNNVPTMVDHDTRARGAEQQEEEEEEEQEIDAVDRSLRSREVIVSNGIQVDLGVSSSSSSSTSPDFTLPSISISREAPALISTSTSIPAISAASTSTATLTAGSTLNAQQANASRPGSMATTAVATTHHHHHHPLPPYTHAHSHHGFGFGLPPTLPPIMTDMAVDADTDIINEDTANDDDGGEAREVWERRRMSQQFISQSQAQRLGEVQLPSPSLSGFYDWLEGASVGAARGTGSEGDRTGVGMGVGAVSGRVEPAGFTTGGDATGAAVVVDERSGSRVQTHGASWQEDVLSGLGLNQGSFNNNNTSSQPNGERRDSGEPTTARSEGVVVDIDMVSDMEVERLPWTLGVPATTTTSQAPPLRLDSPNDDAEERGMAHDSTRLRLLTERLGSMRDEMLNEMLQWWDRDDDSVLSDDMDIDADQRESRNSNAAHTSRAGDRRPGLQNLRRPDLFTPPTLTRPNVSTNRTTSSTSLNSERQNGVIDPTLFAPGPFRNTMENLATRAREYAAQASSSRPATSMSSPAAPSSTYPSSLSPPATYTLSAASRPRPPTTMNPQSPPVIPPLAFENDRQSLADGPVNSREPRSDVQEPLSSTAQQWINRSDELLRRQQALRNYLGSRYQDPSRSLNDLSASSSSVSSASSNERPVSLFQLERSPERAESVTGNSSTSRVGAGADGEYPEGLRDALRVLRGDGLSVDRSMQILDQFRQQRADPRASAGAVMTGGGSEGRAEQRRDGEGPKNYGAGFEDTDDYEA